MEESGGSREQPRDEDRVALPAGIAVREGGGVPRVLRDDRGRVTLALDLAVYSLDAATRAAYKFTDRAYIFLAIEDGSLLVTLSGKVPLAPEALGALVGDFGNELLDQRLRESLAREFGPIQAAITAHAFAPAGLTDAADPAGAKNKG